MTDTDKCPAAVIFQGRLKADKVSAEAKAKKADLAAAGVTPTMLRISVGLENTDDLIDDFEQAFAHIG